MNAERIDKASPEFADIQYQVKRRQVTITLNRILMDPKVVLCKSPNSLPKSFKVFAAKDVKTDKVLKVFIDVSDIMRNGALTGEGKPELLKGDLTGYYSRRINEKERLIYKVLDENVVEIYSCKGHYSDK